MWQQVSQSANNFGEAMINALSVLGSKLGMVAQHLYLVLVKQQLLIGVQKLSLGVVMVIVSCALYISGKRIYGMKKLDVLDKAVLIVVIGIGIYILLPSGVTLIVDSIPRIINPEYYAVQEAVQMLKEIRVAH